MTVQYDDRKGLTYDAPAQMSPMAYRSVQPGRHAGVAPESAPTLTDVALTEKHPVRAVLHDYFAWATTTTMSRYHDSADDVPDDLHIPHWSWHGLTS